MSISRDALIYLANWTSSLCKYLENIAFQYPTGEVNSQNSNGFLKIRFQFLKRQKTKSEAYFSGYVYHLMVFLTFILGDIDQKLI